MITNRTRRNSPFKQALLPITKETVEEGNDTSWSTTDVNQVTIRKEQDPFLNIPNLLSEWEIENVHPLIKNLFLSREIPKVPLAGRLKHFKKKLGSTNTRSSRSVNSGRVQNTFHRGANTISITSKSSFQFGANKFDRSGGSGDVEKRGNTKGSTSGEPIFKQSISGQEKGLGESPSNKSKKFELFHCIPPFQNGGSSSTKRFITGMRLPVQAGPEGCIFLHSNERTVKEICPFPLERDSVGVPLHVLRSRSSPSYIHKTFENTHWSSAKNKYQTDYFYRRYVSNGENSGGESGYHGFPSTEFGVCNQSEKISIGTSSGDRISRTENQLPRLNFMSSPGKGRKDYKPMSNSTRQYTDNSDGPDKSNRAAIFYSKSCSPRQDANALPAAATNIEFENNKFISFTDYSEQKFTIRNNLVERKPFTLQWETSESVSTRPGHTNRCIQGGLGSIVHRSTGGSWTNQEKVKHINVLELLAVKLAILTFTKTLKVTLIHLQIDNITALSYLQKMGGTKSPELLEISKQIWEYLISRQIMITTEYLPSKLNLVADRESRNIQDTSDWKLNPQVFQKITKIMGTPDMDLFASRLTYQVPAYMAWRPDPGSKATDAFQQKWEHLFPYAFPPFALINRTLSKVNKDQVRIILVTPTWQTQPWYATLLHMSIRNPILLPGSRTLQDYAGNLHPLMNPEN